MSSFFQIALLLHWLTSFVALSSAHALQISWQLVRKASIDLSLLFISMNNCNLRPFSGSTTNQNFPVSAGAFLSIERQTLSCSLCCHQCNWLASEPPLLALNIRNPENSRTSFCSVSLSSLLSSTTTRCALTSWIFSPCLHSWLTLNHQAT